MLFSHGSRCSLSFLVSLAAVLTPCGGSTAAQPPAPAPARPAAFFGINDDPVWNYGAGEVGRFLDLLQGSGAGALRLPIRWTVLEPQKSRWDFAAVDRVVRRIPAEIEIVGVLLSVPQWANGVDPAKATGWPDAYPPTSTEDWSTYVSTTVSHYRGRIRHWEIWNEENGAEFYRPGPDAQAYTELLKAGYVAAKRAAPECVVLLGGLQMNGIVPNPWSAGQVSGYLEALYKAGAAPYFDVCNIHPYVSPEEGAGRMMELVRDTLALMARYGDGAKPLWITEVGCGAPTKEAVQRQAELLSATYEAAKQEPRLQRVFWFVLRDLQKDSLAAESTMGLYDFQGQPKPALEAFRKAARGQRAP
jgi:polysaccharide biosynthesis protein PslG